MIKKRNDITLNSIYFNLMSAVYSTTVTFNHIKICSRWTSTQFTPFYVSGRHFVHLTATSVREQQKTTILPKNTVLHNSLPYINWYYSVSLQLNHFRYSNWQWHTFLRRLSVLCMHTKSRLKRSSSWRSTITVGVRIILYVLRISATS